MIFAFRTAFVAATIALALAGCQQSVAPLNPPNGAPAQSVGSVGPIPQMPQGDPSVPDASTVFAAQDTAEKAKAMTDTTALQQKAAPQEKMTTAEETKAMPLPGQANDHSTTALDKGKGG